MSPLRMRRSSALASADDSVEFSAAARTPSSSSAATWSAISAISGETTIPTPGRTSAGIWYVSDFPPPVGISTSASPPATTCSITSRWKPRKLS